jgi:uncharacterized membrane protein YcaP (DUF421 family)
MDSLIELSAPGWQFALRALLVYVFMLLLLRIAGKRTVGEFTPFDLVVVILLGESMQSAMVPDDKSIIAPFIVAATLVALNYLIGFASARSRKFDKLVTGEPVMLVRNGKVLTRAMLSQNVPAADLTEAIRRAGLERTSEVSLAVLETDGEITIVPHATLAHAD